MNSSTDNKQQGIYNYFILTFFISWALWSPLYFSENVSEFWALPGAWGPSIAAIILTLINKGKVGVKNLFKKLLIWRVHVKYYFFSIFIILIVGLLSILIFALFGGELPEIAIVLKGMGLEDGDFGLALLLLPVFYLINTLLGGPIAEELGWRGYAQGLLQEKYNPNISGLIIGFLWSMWHLPLFIFLPKAVGSMPIWAYIPLMTAMGVIFSWLYNNTKASVLLAILLHGGMNFAQGFLGADVFSNVKLLAIQVCLIIVLAIVLSKRNNKPVANTVYN
jgi:membrane protease YdiL (CAAX protease family)